MERTLTKALVAFENATYRGTNSTGENNRSLGFQPAFIDRDTGTVYLSCYLTAGLPLAICWTGYQVNLCSRAVGSGA